MALVEQGLRPRDIITRESIANAFAVDMAPVLARIPIQMETMRHYMSELIKGWDVDTVRRIVAEDGKRWYVVVSAPGKDKKDSEKVTDHLFNIATDGQHFKARGKGISARESYDQVLGKFTSLITDLAIEGEDIIEGLETDLKKVEDTRIEDLLNYDCLVFGSPTYYGSMAWPLKKLLDESVKFHGKLRGKVGGAFASSANVGGGNETTVLDVLHALLIHGMVDDNVHLQNTINFIEALVRDGKPYQLYLQPGEKHGFSAYSARLYLTKRRLKFFDENLHPASK